MDWTQAVAKTAVCPCFFPPHPSLVDKVLFLGDIGVFFFWFLEGRKEPATCGCSCA